VWWWSPSVSSRAAPVDLVWTSQNYHDLHNFPGLDVGYSIKMVFDDLKPAASIWSSTTAEAGSAGRDTKTCTGSTGL